MRRDYRNLKLVSMVYFGGKSRSSIRDFVNARLHQDSPVYVEPFGGMLGILLSRQPSMMEIANDADMDIINWWRTVKEHTDDLIYLIDHTPHSKLTYFECVNALETGLYANKPFRTTERARCKRKELIWAWVVFVIIQHGVMHAINKVGWGAILAEKERRRRYATKFTKNMTQIAERMRTVNLNNKDANVLLKSTLDIKNAMIYCDPPYRTADIGAYKHQLDWNVFTRLIKQQKSKVAISGYNDEWDHLDWQKHEHNTFYSHMGSTSKRESETRTEILWTNYDAHVMPNLQQSLF